MIIVAVHKSWYKTTRACIATEQVSPIITDHIFKVILKSGDTIMQSKGPKTEVTIQDRILKIGRAHV